MNLSLWLSTLFATASGVNAATYNTISNQYNCFRSMDGMMDSMNDLASDNPSLVTISDIGDSYLKNNPGRKDGDYDIPTGGYDIHAIKITASNSARQSNQNQKGKMLITSGVHAREWAPPELLARFIEMLVNGYDDNADITWILQHVEIHAILYVNPDGRYMAEKYPELYWRKNLNPSGGCKSDGEYGVDINRNMDFMWAFEDGSSNSPCESDYHGKRAESEPETKALADYARDLFPEDQRKKNPEGQKDESFGEDVTGMYIDIHASGGYVYYPWGHEDSQSPDDEALQALGRKMNYFNNYLLWAGGQQDFLYPASGDISDWMYAAMGVASMGFEIGDDWQQNCRVFENQVVPINLPALLYAAKTAAKPFKEIKGPDVFDLGVSKSNGQVWVTARVSDSEMVNAIKDFPDFTTGAQTIEKVQLYLDVHPDDYQSGDTRWEMQAVNRRLEEDSIISMERRSKSCASITQKKECKRFEGGDVCEWLTISETCTSANGSSVSTAIVNEKPTVNNASIECSEFTRKGRCNNAGGGGLCYWDSAEKHCEATNSSSSFVDSNGPAPNDATGTLDSGDETVFLTIEASSLSPGRHSLFVQAMDSDGYKGPVSSVFVNVSSRGLRLRGIN